MVEKLQQIAKEKIGELPQEMQTAIAACDWPGISEEIGKKYLPLESQVNSLQTQILLVLLGLVDPVLMAESIETFVDNVSKEESEKIATEIIEKILDPIGERIGAEIMANPEIVNSADLNRNVGFILSGGNYGEFLKRSGAANRL